MGARERSFEVLVEVSTENDGPVYLRRGPESHSEIMRLDTAVRDFSADRIETVLEQALAVVRSRKALSR